MHPDMGHELRFGNRVTHGPWHGNRHWHMHGQRVEGGGMTDLKLVLKFGHLGGSGVFDTFWAIEEALWQLASCSLSSCVTAVWLWLVGFVIGLLLKGLEDPAEHLSKGFGRLDGWVLNVGAVLCKQVCWQQIMQVTQLWSAGLGFTMPLWSLWQWTRKTQGCSLNPWYSTGCSKSHSCKSK